MHSGAVKSWLAFAFEVRGLWHKNTVSVGVAMGLSIGQGFARVNAFGFACLKNNYIIKEPLKPIL